MAVKATMVNENYEPNEQEEQVLGVIRVSVRRIFGFEIDSSKFVSWLRDCPA